MSSAAASAASQAITNIAAQTIAGGDVDVKGALISAAIGYGGTSLGDIINNSSEIDGVLGSIVSSANEGLANLEALIETGIPIADAAIQAGGLNMLTQLVSTGDIDLEQAAIAALIAGGSEAVNQLAVASGQDADEFMADLAQQEEFQQAAIDADIKDPFLNPNYQTVGDGSVVLNTVTNEVFSVTDNKSLGQFNELDSNSDGILDSNDLSFVEVTATPVDIGGTVTGQEFVPFKYDSQGNVIASEDYFSESGRYYINESGTVYNTNDLTYVDGGPNNTLLVQDSNGNQFYVRDARYNAGSGSFYDPDTGASLGVTSAFDPSSGNVFLAKQQAWA